MVGKIESIIHDMESGVFDFTKDGECSSCGQCCSNFLPVSGKEIKQIQRYIRKKRIPEQKHIIPTSAPVEDWTCPFRDNTNRRCVIYQVRPAICRDFRCDKPKKQISADKAMYHGKYLVVDMRKKFFDEGAGSET